MFSGFTQTVKTEFKFHISFFLIIIPRYIFYDSFNKYDSLFNPIRMVFPTWSAVNTDFRRQLDFSFYCYAHVHKVNL